MSKRFKVTYLKDGDLKYQFMEDCCDWCNVAYQFQMWCASHGVPTYGVVSIELEPTPG